jgi:hypothetical protein
MRKPLLLLTILTCFGCPPAVTPAANSNLCGPMCAHIGPIDEGGLGCTEGEPVYNSTLPGDPGVPNESCTQFCVHQQANGVNVNPSCVMRVTSCFDIEAARQKTCN